MEHTIDIRKEIKGINLKIRVVGGIQASLRFRLMGHLLKFAAWVGGIDRFEISEDESGVIRVGTEAGNRISHVLLDGKSVEKVFACLPGAYGWVDRYVTDDVGKIVLSAGEIQTERLYGNVAVFEKDCG